jgi:hypothetical protein
VKYWNGCGTISECVTRWTSSGASLMKALRQTSSGIATELFPDEAASWLNSS